MMETMEQSLLQMAESQGLNSLAYTVEHSVLEAVLIKYPTRAAGARAMGLNRTTFIEKLRRHGLFAPRAVRGHKRIDSEVTTA